MNANTLGLGGRFWMRGMFTRASLEKPKKCIARAKGIERENQKVCWVKPSEMYQRIARRHSMIPTALHINPDKSKRKDLEARGFK
jgi:hypothetical protein